MISTFCDEILSVYTHCLPVEAVYTYGELVWPTTLPSSHYYVHWDRGYYYNMSDRFTMEGVGHYYRDYSSYNTQFSSSSIFTPFQGVITEYAFYDGPFMYYETNAYSTSSHAVEWCLSLRSVSMSKCRYIGDWTFSYCSSLSSVYLPKCSYVGVEAFYGCRNISAVNFLPRCRYIDAGAFSIASITSYSDKTMKRVTLPLCSYIGSGAFAYQEKISSISLPVCEYIGVGAFFQVSSLNNIYLPKCTSIDNQAFYDVGTSSISLPVCEYIGAQAFNGTGGNNLSQIYLPKCSYIGPGAFANNNNLSNISLPECEYIGAGAFNFCTIDNLLYSQVLDLPKCSYIGYAPFTLLNRTYWAAFKYINLPVCKTLDGYALHTLPYLSSVSVPECEYLSDHAFLNCYRLSSIALPKCSFIGSAAFSSCVRLTNVTIQSTRVCHLESSNVFNDTPIKGYSSYTSVPGSIYVPYSLVNSYKADSIWSWFESRIYPIPGV